MTRETLLQMAKYALVSVYDKTNIASFAKSLLSFGYQIISTGGTATVLQDAKIPFIPIQEVTGNPESFDGRMKTISFEVESGLLYDRKNPSHKKQAKELGIKQIDVVVNNLYPFEKTVEQKNTTYQKAIEQIDVGGPTMIRAAAKNGLIVVVNPSDYDKVAKALKTKKIPQQLIRELQAKAFAHLSFYDSQIAWYFRNQLEQTSFPEELTLPGRRLLDLRYGENPHQQGAVYLRPNAKTPFQNLSKLSGRDLSLINITDINAGIESVRLFSEPAAVVIKHNNPSGVALGNTIKEALSRAIEADPESAFGGTIVLNKTMTLAAAKVIGDFKDERRSNIDIVGTPDIDKEALTFLQKVRKTMGIYSFGDIPKIEDPIHIKWLDGGYVVQTSDLEIEKSFKDWKVVTKKKPTKQQLLQMQFGWKFVSRVKSNSILVVDELIPMTRGIGSGQTSRVRSTRLALEQAGKKAKRGIMVSDSFFPFDDSIKLAATYGISAVVQQGGSINDQASIAAADEAGIVMVMTGRRAFWH